MKKEINPALWQELKKHGQEMTPEELRLRGVKRLITIKTSEVSRSIERAINRTIMERTIGRAQAQDLLDFSVATGNEFVASYGLGDEPVGLAEVIQQHRLELQAELEAVQQDLSERRGFAEQQEAPERWPIEPERADDLRLRVQARLLPVFERLPAGSPPLRAVVGDLLELFAEERAASLAELRRQVDADTARLERRIAKLVASLEHSELVLDRVTREAKSTGRASGYREVQGLDANVAEPERRREMLAGIFRANVELQGVELQERGSAPTVVVKEHSASNGAD